MLSILNASGFRKWSHDCGTAINRDVAVSDLDRDGKLEVLVSAGNKLYIFGEKQDVTTTLAPAATTATSTSSPTTTTTTTTSSTTTSTVKASIAVSSVTPTTIAREAARIGLNDFIYFMLALLASFLVVGLAAKALHRLITRKMVAGIKQSGGGRIIRRRGSPLQEGRAP